MTTSRRILGRFIRLIPNKVFAALQDEWAGKQADCIKKSLRTCGSNVSVAAQVQIISPARVSVGNDSMINEYVHILGGGQVTIGNGVWIANHASIISVTHPVDVEFIGAHPQVEQPVIIEDNVWIGSHAVILPGVTLGESCVIGAGSVVTKSVPARAVAVGTPARVVRLKNIE